MEELFERSTLLWGEDGIEKLRRSHVAVFGLGGVGGHALEAIVRSGVGEMTIVDNDTVSPSNINRQIIATTKTIGMKKTDVAKERILSINPNCIVHAYSLFFLPGKENELPFSSFSYIVDAIDTVSGKIALIEEAERLSIPIISSMGAGNKVDPTLFRVSDIFSTNTDPLSRVLRHELKKRGIKKLKVVWSPEKPITPKLEIKSQEDSRKSTPGSNAFTPSVAGLIMGGEVVKDIIKTQF